MAGEACDFSFFGIICFYAKSSAQITYATSNWQLMEKYRPLCPFKDTDYVSATELGTYGLSTLTVVLRNILSIHNKPKITEK